MMLWETLVLVKFMRPSIEGSGVIAGGAVRIVLEVAGVKNCKTIRV
jgi:ribosomal protein S5